MAQQFYQDYEALDYPVLLEKLDQTVEKIKVIIDKTDQEKLYGENWYKNYSMGRMIQLNTSSPYKNARGRIRKWLRTLKQKPDKF